MNYVRLTIMPSNTVLKVNDPDLQTLSFQKDEDCIVGSQSISMDDKCRVIIPKKFVDWLKKTKNHPALNADLISEENGSFSLRIFSKKQDDKSLGASIDLHIDSSNRISIRNYLNDLGVLNISKTKLIISGCWDHVVICSEETHKPYTRDFSKSEIEMLEKLGF